MNNSIIGYDSQTGQPIYENKNNLNSSNVNRNIRYDSQTGQPIYNYLNETKRKKKNNLLFIFGGLGTFLLVVGIILILFTDRSTSRTIMIYMVGSDLESRSGLASIDLDGINYNQMDNKNINVVLIAGGTKEWTNNYINSNETSIYQLKENGYQKVKAQNLQNMGSSSVLSNFLNYVYDNYKTDEYDLIFWNHGSAIMGGEHDEISGDNLSLEEFKNGLSNSKFNKNNKLETVIFRTCLNGSIEVATIFSDYADYFVASEEITVGSVLDNVLGFVNDIKKTDNGYDYSLKYINSYIDQVDSIKEYYELYGQQSNIYSTYSIIDLKRMDDLEKSVNEFFSSINVNGNYSKIAKVRSNLLQYASTEPAYDMVDLYNLVYDLKELAPDKADKVLKNFEKAVVYNWASDSESKGLSIYFPYNGENNYKTAFLNIYSGFDSLDKYNMFIKTFNNIQMNSNRNFSFFNNKFSLTEQNQNYDFNLELTDEQLDGYAKASYMVFRDNKDGYYLPVYMGKNVTLNGNKLGANIKDKQLKVIATDDNSESIINLIEEDVTDSFIKYQTNVILEDFSGDMSDWKIDNAKMSLMFDKKSNEIKIGDIFLTSKIENTPSGIVSVNLDDYSAIAFASYKYKIVDENGNYNENWESNGVLKGIEAKMDKFKFEQQSFEDGYDYYCVFKIYDVDNNYYYSKLVKMN